MNVFLKGRNSLNLIVSCRGPDFYFVLRKQSTQQNPIIAELHCFQTVSEKIFSEGSCLKATTEEWVGNTNIYLNGKSISNVYFIGEVKKKKSTVDLHEEFCLSLCLV